MAAEGSALAGLAPLYLGASGLGFEGSRIVTFSTPLGSPGFTSCVFKFYKLSIDQFITIINIDQFIIPLYLGVFSSIIL